MYDVIIIGSGPAGYVAAIRAGQVGLKTAIIEQKQIGGMCLNWGCIPSKAMLESIKLYNKIKTDADRFGVDGINKEKLSFNWNKAIKRSNTIVKRLSGGVEFLLKKNGVDILTGKAKILSNKAVMVDNQIVESKNVIIATGSSSPKLENSIEGLVAEPVDLFKEREIPENIVVLGKSSTAIELTQAFCLMDRKVTLISDTDEIVPLLDPYIKKFMLSKLNKDKVKIVFNANINSTLGCWADHLLTVNQEKVPCDLIVNAMNRTGNLIESDIALEINNGFLKVDKNFETSVKGIYAIGDVNGLSSFAHIASAEGLHVINSLMGIKTEFDISKLPINMYSMPEVAQVGLTEPELKEKNIDYKISEFPLSANGKAMTEGLTEGFLRILSENKYGEVLGVQIIASNATDMINEASAYIQLESTVYDIARTVHTHPTISEIFMEAGFEAVDYAIHK